MQADFHHEAPLAQRRLPAWLFSFVFHGSAIVALGLLVEMAPRGAAEQAGREAGIVLKRSTEGGELYEGEQSVADSAETPAQQLSPEQLAAALPSDTAAPDVSSDLPQRPTAGAGPTAAGGQPSARQFARGGSPRGAAPGGDEVALRVFGVEGVGSKFVFVFDRSTSMEGGPLAAAKQQLIESLDALESVHQFQIIFFNSDLRVFDLSGGGRRIAFATERNKNLASRFVGGITAEGGTDRLAALKAAVGMRPDVIFFLTDADAPMLGSELAQIARLNRSNATIATIEFGSGPRRQKGNFLVELAERTGGQYGYIDIQRIGR